MDEITRATERQLASLSLPRTTIESLSFCDTTPASLRHYLKNLPHTNPAELCNRLYRALPEVAGLNAPPARKLELLNLIRPEAFACVERLTRKLTVTPTTTKVISLSIAMLRNLAQGYKAVLTTALSGGNAGNIPIDSIVAALSVQNQILMLCWECYLSPPPNTWRETHSLFRIARQLNLDNVPGPGPDRSRLTPRTAYLRPLLIACADPARYTPVELRMIADFLSTSASLAELNPSDGAGLFLVDTESDRGPFYSFKAQDITANHWRIHPQELVDFLNHQPAAQTPYSLNRRLAEDLNRYWSREIRRREEPVRDETPATIVLGLTSIHLSLAGTGSVEAFVHTILARTENLRLQLLDDDTEHRGRSIDRTDRKRTPLVTDSVEFTPSTGSKARVRRFDGVRRNYSSDGARIELPSPEGSVSIGQLVAIFTPDSTEPQVGIVRWARVTPQLKRVFGVQLFTSAVEPCAVSLEAMPRNLQGLVADKTNWYENRHRQTHFYPALRFSGRDQLLLPSLPFKANTRVTLYRKERVEQLQLHTIAEGSFHISCFNVKPSAHS